MTLLGFKDCEMLSAHVQMHAQHVVHEHMHGKHAGIASMQVATPSKGNILAMRF